VAKGCPQRAGNLEVALAGDWIDIRRTAAAVLSVDRERHAADPYVAADLVQLLPGPGATNVRLARKRNGSTGVRQSSSSARTMARLISEITLSGFSMKWPPRERNRTGGPGKFGVALRRGPRLCRLLPCELGAPVPRQ
jgi:hypothetical protein